MDYFFWEFNGGLNLAVFCASLFIVLSDENRRSNSCEARLGVFRETISQKLFHFSSLLRRVVVRAAKKDHKIL